MDQNTNETQEFLDSIKEEQPSSLEETLGFPKAEEAPAEVPGKDETEDDAQPHKNRKHRRWESRLEARERELIAREARAQALDEFNAERLTKDSEVDPRLLQLFGNEETGKQAAALFDQLLKENRSSVREEIIRETEQRQQQEAAAQREAEEQLSESFESLEDEFGTDLTSNAPAARKARNEMLELLEKYSPKDSDGDIIEYADMNGIYEIWQMKKSQSKPAANPRQKELASRSMEAGEGGEQAPKPKDASRFSNWRQWAGIE